MKPVKPDFVGSIIGFCVFSLFVVGGLYGTIVSSSLVYESYLNGEHDKLLIWLVLGVFMFIWFLYFAKELYELIKQKTKK